MRNSEFDEAMHAAMAAGAKNDSHAAIAAYLEAHELEPEAMEPVFLLAAEYATLGDVVRAEEAYALAILRAPGFNLARFQLGLLQLASGKAAQASITWEKLLGLERPAYWGILTKGFLLLHNGSIEEAIELLEEAASSIRDNAPLAADVRETIKRARVRSVSDGGNNVGVERAEDAATMTDSHHVLISGYLSQAR